MAGSPRAAGYGQNPKAYLTRANNQILVLAAIETSQAVENLDEILTVPGLDGIFIGPMDLATSMGHPFDPTQAAVQAAIAAIEQKALAAGTVGKFCEVYPKG